jgi:hypothetical protein
MADQQAASQDAAIAFPQLADFKRKCHKNFIFSHLNINSLRNKFHEVSELLSNDYVDLLCISETKLDSSFTSSQFHVTDFKIHRKDRDAHGGGLMIYVRSSIPHRLRNDLSTNIVSDYSDIEILVLELMLKGEKVIMICVYKPPSSRNVNLINALSNVLDRCLSDAKSVYIIGDINIDMQCTPAPFTDFMTMYNLCNIIEKPTCFKSVQNPSLLDVVLTNTPRRLLSHLNVSVGVSDHHNIICAATKVHLARNGKRHIKYRTMKNFNNDQYNSDLSKVPFHVCQIFDDPDDIMWCYNMMLCDVIDEHAPVKQKTLKKPQLPYMNGPLRKAINVKAMLRRKYDRFKDRKSWLKYKAQRNHVNSLKRQSVTKYFNQRCNEIVNSKSFWKTVRPFMAEDSASNTAITLLEHENVVTNQSDVCKIFNEYFIDIAEDLAECQEVNDMNCEQLCDFYSSHEAVKFIEDKVGSSNVDCFSFSHVTVKDTHNRLSKLKVNKACGFDMIPAKFIKYGAEFLSHSLTNVINLCIDYCVFPDICKHAEVSPIYKKKDQLIKCNYRPVSILTAFSKVIEGVMCDQLMSYFNEKLSAMLSAYRSKYSCANVILKCIEDWRLSLDKNDIVGCVAMDLSRAFDSIPHGLLIAKLNTYGVALDSCCLVKSYLTDRKQRVKIGQN